jgi:hypothetical protein
MNLLGVHLTVLLGETIPGPAPLAVSEALQSVEVTHSDRGPSGFQITLHVGRSSVLDLPDYRLLTDPRLKPFNRVILIVRFAVAPQVLMDGFITNQQLNPGNEPGTSTLTLTGEDVSVMMDLEETPRQHPALPDGAIVRKLIAPYTVSLGLVPDVIDPPTIAVQNPAEGTQQQPSNYTDRAYIQALAQRYGFVFYVEPGPLPKVNRAYWGPQKRLDLPQRALSVNMGPDTNVGSINFRNNALAPNAVAFRSGATEQRIGGPSPTRLPLVRNRAELRRTRYLSTADPLSEQQARDRAQGMVDESLEEVVTATGELDALRYDGLLMARGIVDLRGAGQSYDGSYYVKSVTHNISKGEYRQRFTLTREGTGTLKPLVRT